MSRGRFRGRAGAVALCGAGLAVAAVSGWSLVTGPRGEAAGAVSPPPVPRWPASAAADAGRGGPAVPERIRAPGLHARLVPVAARADGALDLPEDGRSGAWWALGAPVGAAAGTVLVAGHVDTRRGGLGAFAALHALGPGTPVEVVGANGHTYRYVVTARRTYPQRSLPRELFGRGGAHRLALVTCSGSYDEAAGGYDRNLVLYATPVPDGETRHGR